jgi:SAM-dependent methyltransferase
MLTIERWMPDWRERQIHESSPCGRGASVKLAQARGYSASQYYPALPAGAPVPGGWLNQNLESLSFADETFHLVVTQDVMEHVFDPDRAFAEIGRVLKPGGMHIFTTPLMNRSRASERRALLHPDRSVTHMAPPEYHGNPVDAAGSLVTFYWGYDIVEHVYRASGLVSAIVCIDDLSRGIRADLNEVIVSVKTLNGRAGAAT